MSQDQTPNQELKFERRGFKTETGAEAEEQPGATEVTAEDADALAAEMQAGAPQEMTFDDGQAEEGEPEEGQAEAAKAKIRIGDRDFVSQQEAFDYANELAQKDLVNDAFRHGLEKGVSATGGLPQEAAPVQPDPDEKFDEEFYANPKEYLKKVRQQIKDEVKGEISHQDATKKRSDETWGKFYADYPDLDRNRDLVTYTLQQNWSHLGHIDTDKALKILADKVRDTKRSWLGEITPGQELPKVRTTASPGSSREVTRSAAPQKELSFVEQMKSNNNSKKRSARRGVK